MANDQTPPVVTPPAAPQPSVREKQLQAEIDKLKADAVERDEAENATTSAAAKKLKKDYKVPAGEEGFHHVLITEQGGVQLAEPVVKAFEPLQYEKSISKLSGFKGEIIHKAKK